jgi:hypothetical protein
LDKHLPKDDTIFLKREYFIANSFFLKKNSTNHDRKLGLIVGEGVKRSMPNWLYIYEFLGKNSQVQLKSTYGCLPL